MKWYLIVVLICKAMVFPVVILEFKLLTPAMVSEAERWWALAVAER